MWAGWVNRAQQNQIYYLKEENRILREQVGNKRLHLTNTQRRRLAEKAKTVGRKALREQEALSHTPGSIKRKAQVEASASARRRWVVRLAASWDERPWRR